MSFLYYVEVTILFVLYWTFVLILHTLSLFSSWMNSLSGGNDPAHGNQTNLEEALNAGDADWEITRYSGVDHGYTVWGAPAYSLKADYRSWESMVTAFEKLMPVPQLASDVGDPTVPVDPEQPGVTPDGSDSPSAVPSMMTTPSPTTVDATSGMPSQVPTIVSAEASDTTKAPTPVPPTSNAVRAHLLLALIATCFCGVASTLVV